MTTEDTANERRREVWAALRAERADRLIPRDVVRPGLTVAGLREMNDMVGQAVRTVEDPDLLEDVHGLPLAVGQPTVTNESVGSPIIRADVFRRLGVDPADFPNLTCYDPTPTKDER